MKIPLVSIIIPVYNSEKSIKEIVGQVLNQTEKNFELIIVNDGSTDNTLKTINALAKSSNRIRVINQKNAGPGAARNSGLDIAKGKYIMFFDSDDGIHENILEKTTSYMERKNLDMAIFGWREISQAKAKLVTFSDSIINFDKKNIKGYVISSLGDNALFYAIWNKIYRNDLIQKNKLRFKTDINFGEDLIFNLNYLSKTKKFGIISEPLYDYKVSSTGSVFSKSSLDFSMRLKNNQAIDEFVGKTNEEQLTDSVNWLKTKWLVQYLLTVQRSSMTKKQKKDVSRHALNSIKLAPLSDKSNRKKRFIVKQMIRGQHHQRSLILMLKIISILK